MHNNEQWPNAFIVGAEKSGTTSLYTYLKDISSDVFMSSEKGPRYFHKHNVDVYLGRPETRITSKSEYLKLFQNVKDEKIIVEASASYLRDPETPKLIHDIIPHAKIIIMLRDPVERAFSSYLMRRANGREKRSFHEMILDSLAKREQTDEYNLSLDAGLYVKQVKRYIDTFGSEQVGIWIFEEFVKNPKKIVKNILEFLGMDFVPCKSIGKAYNTYGHPRGRLGQYIIENKKIRELSIKIIPQNIRWSLKQSILLKRDKKPDLTNEDRTILENFYRKDIKELEELLMRKFPWQGINR